MLPPSGLHTVASGARILVVDDELSLRRALSTTLTMMGFIVSAQPTGEEAIECARNQPFDAVLLDVNMPGIGGMATCRLLRQQHPRLGILMVTVRHDPKDKIEALESGADDYVVKPFDSPELVARLRAVVRRTQLSSQDVSTPIRIGDLELDRRNRSLTKSGKPVHLTPNEFALLYCLMSREGLVCRTEVLRAVWEEDGGADASRLRSLVRQLRKKIEANPGSPRYLLTEPGFGYRFRS